MMQWVSQKFLSPKGFYATTTPLIPWLTITVILLLFYGIFAGLFIAPVDYQQGDGFRIIYVHVPSAFVAMTIYFVMASSAFVVLVWRIKIAAICMSSSAAIGAWFTLLALVTGAIWGKPMWGTWWVWDARLTSVLILLFLYLGFIALQSIISDPTYRERATSIIALTGALNLPIIHYSVTWWNTLHQGPTIGKLDLPSMDSTMLYPLLASILGFMLFYLLILILRMRNQILLREIKTEWVKEIC